MSFCAQKLMWRSQLFCDIRRILWSTQNNAGFKTSMKREHIKEGAQDLYVASAFSYRKAEDIPLPVNVEDINSIETARFSPHRSRDITGDVIGTLSSPANTDLGQDSNSDSAIESYDCTGAVNLSSSMQTNVPNPYTCKGKAPTHLNMPGGDWGRSDKYVAQDLQNSHYTYVREQGDGNHDVSTIKNSKGTYSIPKVLEVLGYRVHLRQYSSDAGTPHGNERDAIKEDKVSKLKRAVKDYGGTVIVFHVGISLISLGGCYLAVTSGLDIARFMPAELPSEVASEVGSFVVAYAIHKVLAPLRISITLFCTPFIVRHLRKIGLLSSPKPPI